MQNKISNLQYCYGKALEALREQYPDAAENCFAGDYQAAYWNDEEAYVDLKGAWEYPGRWYPSPVAYTDEQMIDYLIKKGLAKLEEAQKEG